MSVLIDSDILIEYLRGNETAIQRLSKLYKSGQVLCFSPVTKAEITAGLRKGEEEITGKLFSLMECLEINDKIGEKAGEYMKIFRPSHNLEIADALIAATAYCNSVTLWSRNKKHYPMTDLAYFQ